MSFKKIIICDDCGREIHPWDEEKFRLGYRHSCKDCQTKRYGSCLNDYLLKNNLIKAEEV